MYLEPKTPLYVEPKTHGSGEVDKISGKKSTGGASKMSKISNRVAGFKLAQQLVHSKIDSLAAEISKVEQTMLDMHNQFKSDWITLQPIVGKLVTMVGFLNEDGKIDSEQ